MNTFEPRWKRRMGRVIASRCHDLVRKGYLDALAAVLAMAGLLGLLAIFLREINR